MFTYQSILLSILKIKLPIHHRLKMVALLPLVAILFAFFLGVALNVHPAYAAIEIDKATEMGKDIDKAMIKEMDKGKAYIDCPANGDGPEDSLAFAVAVLPLVTVDGSIIISVTGDECLFSLTDIFTTTSNGPVGLPPITGSLTIRAVGGRAIIERVPQKAEFRLLESDAALTLENLTLRNGKAGFYTNAAKSAGGAILAHQPLTLTNVIITGNVSYRGGAVSAESSLVLNHVTADGNQTLSADTSDGGAIYVAGSLTATSITVTHNLATDCFCGRDVGRGGGIFVTGTAVISNAQFLHNRSLYEEGGALYVNGDLKLAKSTFFANESYWHGGALFVQGDLMLTSSDFISNFADGSGGGVYLEGPASITASHFISNVSDWLGGGLASTLPLTVTVEESSFISNVAENGGGAAIEQGVVRQSLFQSNNVSQGQPVVGGGGLLVGSFATIESNRFIGNSAPTGGGLQLLFYPLTGGIEAETSANAAAMDPAAETDEAIIAAGLAETASQIDSLIVNNLFVDNEARGVNGAAIASGINFDGLDGGFVQIRHNTIVRKQSDSSSALFVARSGASVENNIFTQHGIAIQALKGTGNGTGKDKVTANANLMQGMAINYLGVANGAKDLTADPLIVDPARRNFHLQAQSPARDSGLELGVMTDLDGLARSQGKGFDRGAFEFVNNAPLAQSESYTTPVGTTLVVVAPGLLANDSDPDGDALALTLTTPPTHGALTLQANGAFIYTPTAAFAGTDIFFYRANDGAKHSIVTKVTISVAGDEGSQVVEIAGLRAANDAPAVVGRAIQFAASVDAGNQIHFTWDFGDGASADGPNASHLYSQAGDYLVKLTARNSRGVQESSFTLRVHEVGEVQYQLSLPMITR